MPASAPALAPTSESKPKPKAVFGAKLSPELVLFLLIQKWGLLFRPADLYERGYTEWQYSHARDKLLSHGLIKRAGRAQFQINRLPESEFF